VRRREFITFVSGAAAWPFAARAQQSAMPVIGFLSNQSAKSDVSATYVAAFLQGLSETGHVEGRNVAIEYRWANGNNDVLPKLAADLVARRVNVIAAFADTSAVAAQAATATIPIVFAIASDPVKHGLVVSLSRPGANITGVTNLNIELGPKRLELLHQLVPTTSTIALLINPSAVAAKSAVEGLPPLAHGLGLEMPVLHASTEAEIDKIFSSLSEQRVGALLISADNFYNNQSVRLGALSRRYGIPAIFQRREFVAAGGLISYASTTVDVNQRVGTYIGRILKGERPADIPVEQPTKFELVINLKTAKALGLSIPQTLIATADEVIE
jgi:putative ABC transport system substrate-binding protein